eukprot:5467983-Amphidinium_carterae.1
MTGTKHFFKYLFDITLKRCPVSLILMASWLQNLGFTYNVLGPVIRSSHSGWATHYRGGLTVDLAKTTELLGSVQGRRSQNDNA